MKSFTKWDKIIFCSLLIICVISSLYVYVIENTGSNETKAIIQVQGKVIKEIPLKKYVKSKLYKFNFNGNNGYIEIQNGNVRMLEMNRNICPKKICSNTGWISKKYEVIACLPNKLEVSIESTKDNALDAISN